ncbi:MAG: hypothetical protein WAN43_09715 [Rhodomicrobium sp.]
MQSKVEQTEEDGALKLSDGAAPENKLSLDWLKIIENATAGLTADLEAVKRERISLSIASEGQRRREAALGPGAISLADRIPAQSTLRAAALAAESRAAETPGGKLAKIANRLVEPWRTPPQTLQAGLRLHAVAAGLCVLILSGVLAFFALGPRPADVEPLSAAASSQPARSPVAEPRGARKGDFRGQAAKVAPSDPPAFAAAMTDPRESAEELAASEPAPTWSETVETFRQFVKAEGRKSAARAGNAR